MQVIFGFLFGVAVGAASALTVVPMAREKYLIRAQTELQKALLEGSKLLSRMSDMIQEEER